MGLRLSQSLAGSGAPSRWCFYCRGGRSEARTRDDGTKTRCVTATLSGCRPPNILTDGGWTSFLHLFLLMKFYLFLADVLMPCPYFIKRAAEEDEVSYGCHSGEYRCAECVTSGQAFQCHQHGPYREHHRSHELRPSYRRFECLHCRVYFSSGCYYMSYGGEGEDSNLPELPSLVPGSPSIGVLLSVCPVRFGTRDRESKSLLLRSLAPDGEASRPLTETNMGPMIGHRFTHLSLWQ